MKYEAMEANVTVHEQFLRRKMVSVSPRGIRFRGGERLQKTEGSAFDEAERFVGSTELRGVFVENDGEGHVLEQILEMPFVFEGLEEAAVLHFFDDFDGDAAGDVDAAEREDFQREIAGFGAVNVGPEVECFDADGASFCERVLGNFRRGIGVGIVKGSVLDGRRQKFVERAETATGKNEFPTDLRIAALHEAKQFDLLFRVGSKIGMAAF